MKNDKLARELLDNFIPDYAEPVKGRQWTVYCWHGVTPSLLDKLGQFCEIDLDNNIRWIGSLSEFYAHWNGPVMVRGDLICVTQYNDFGAR
jgi:hypothetical protein